MTDQRNDCRITLNGQPRTVAEDLPVQSLVELLTPATTGVAVAVNGAVVPRSRWSQERVRPGDVVEVVTAVQGG